MFRVPLWDPVRLPSHAIGSYRIEDILVLDRHELSAGKLAALLSRRTGRDLFDAHELLVEGIPGSPLDQDRLRLGFVVYGAINREDWRTIGVDDIHPATRDLKNNLAPLLRDQILRDAGPMNEWGRRLVAECRDGLSAVLPLNEAEMAFLDRLLREGQIDPGLITADAEMASRLAIHPGLAWKALNAREYRKGGAGGKRAGVGDIEAI